MKLTKRESIKAGMKLWQWLADNPGKMKEDYFRNKKGAQPACNCYACQYAIDTSAGAKCQDCCYLWVLWGSRFCHCNNTIYRKWCDAMCADNTKSANKYAQKIADYHKKLLEEK